jgi:hypothetical protein
MKHLFFNDISYGLIDHNLKNMHVTVAGIPDNVANELGITLKFKGSNYMQILQNGSSTI